MASGIPEIVRNLYKIPKQNSFDIYVGRPSTLNVINLNLSGISNPETDRTPVGFKENSDNMWTFDRYNNISLPVTLHLANNSLSTITGSHKVTVNVGDSSTFVNGQTISIEHAALTGGLTIVQLNIVEPVTVVDGAHVSYDVPGDPATNTVPAGGGNAITLTYNPSFTHIIAHAAPNVEDINNNVQTNIYWGNINSITPLSLIDSVNLPISSGGIIVSYPYIFMYGNNGIISYTLTPNNWSAAVNTPVSSTKVVKAVKTRGGGNTPSILFFSLDSLYRATFQGGNPPFKFDTIQEGISIISQNCVVTDFNVVYWIGINQFYLYNGVVRPLQNDMNRVYFFENLNQKYRNKVFGWFNHLYDEIWWHYPSKNSTECDLVIIFNLKEERWYDSILHRSAVSPPSDPFSYPILADSETILNKYNPITTAKLRIPNNGLSTIADSSTVTVHLDVKTDLKDGNVVTISGAIGFGGISSENLNVNSLINVTSSPNSPTVFNYTASGNADSTIPEGGGNSMFYSPSVANECYGLWQHETESKNMTLYGESFAIRSYFETNIFTLFDKNPAQDRNLRVRRIEPDFKQYGNLSLTVKYRSFAQSTVYSSEPYVFPAGPVDTDLAKADTIEMGRLVSFRFESNEINGDFEAGKIILNYAPGDVRP